MKLRNKLIATIVSISMVLAVIGVGAWASTESFTATITNTVNLEFDNIKGQISVMGMSGADNLEGANEPYLQETTLFDGSNVMYNQISSSATSGQNLYWAGTRFLDSSEDGAQLVDNKTGAAVFGYVFQYKPTDACVGSSTITVMVTETRLPEISGGKLLVKYFATTGGNYTEIMSGEAITPIYDNEMLGIVAVCQYYNLDGLSITTTASAWDFSVTFSAGRNDVSPLTGTYQLDTDPSDGVILPANYVSEGENRWEIIEFGEYPQTLKANNVTITSETPDADGYYPGSDGARYAKLTINLDYVYISAWGDEETYASMGMLTAQDGTKMAEDSTYYFKVEPIKWRVLKTEGNQSLIVADNILKGMAYQATYEYDNGEYYTTANGAPAGTYANNYMYSDLRAYLTGDFYNTAFDTTEQAKILTTEVDNSAATTDNASNPYVCANTNDKVFVLSYADLINEEYKFSSNTEEQDPAKAWKTTDYAKATGAITGTAEFISATAPSEEIAAMLAPYIGSGEMWSRSPNSADSDFAFYAYFAGFSRDRVINPINGCAPAMVITR